MPLVQVVAHNNCPFAFGMGPDELIHASILCSKPVKVGKGFEIHVFKSRHDRWHAVETTSGGLYSHAHSRKGVIAAVRKDIADCKDMSLMKKQVKEAIKASKKARSMSAEEFLECLRK